MISHDIALIVDKILKDEFNNDQYTYELMHKIILNSQDLTIQLAMDVLAKGESGDLMAEVLNMPQMKQFKELEY